MPSIAKGTAKQIAYKKESTWGTLAGAASAKYLRRVTSAFNLAKETYESGEIRTDRQVADFRHGVRSATGSLNGELSPKTYSDFMQSLVGRDFAVVAATTAAALTVTSTTVAGVGAGVANLSVGQVVRVTGTPTTTDVIARNLLITNISGSTLTVRTLNGTAIVAGSVASGIVTPVGKNTFVPASAHTEDSYTVEQWFADIAQSEVYTGVKVGSMNVQLPATGLTTVDFSFMGKDLTQKGTSQYFTSPTAQGTDGIFAAVSGVLLVAGAPVALVTSADFSVERALENATAVGSNSIAEIFSGRIRASGNLSVYFQDAQFRDYFDNETPVSLVMVLTADSTATSSFVSFTLPKVKLGSFTSDDGELGLVSQSSFTALLNDVTTAGLPATTLAIQDSAA